MSADWYYKKYSDNGLKFSDEVLSRYALSLATKPFVILTGISGTGKSKIAQLFEAPPPASVRAAAPPSAASANQNITFTVTTGMLSSDGRGNFDIADVTRVLEQADQTQFENDRQNIISSNAGDINFPNAYEIGIDTSAISQQVPSIKLLVYGQRARNPLLRIRTKTRRGSSPAWSSQDYFQQNHQVGDVIEIEKVSRGKFRVVTLNNTSAVAQSITNRIQQQSSLVTQCFIPVKSNWVDSTELLGYYNQLTEKYQVTKFLRFLLQARENPDVPHFLILDEMNLSKVEHYFSDFLSCLESRRSDGGNIIQEKIALHGSGSLLETDDPVYDEIPSEVEVPLNLYVTGTVNIDDSTHMFSPKVLDRGNVIEFNDVDLTPPANQGLRLASFPDFYNLKLAAMADFYGLNADVKNVVAQILESLKSDNMHFGYRTLAEIASYIDRSTTHIDTTPNTRFASLDIQILQKVLPKFSGTAAKLERPLKVMIHRLSEPLLPIADLTSKKIQEIDITQTQFPRSLAKLIRMYRVVTTQGFVSFIE